MSADPYREWLEAQPVTSDPVWNLGDKHPDAPWTKAGHPFTCPICNTLSRQRDGIKGLTIVDGHPVCYCPDHLDQMPTTWR